MDSAEAQSRKSKKPGAATDALATSARLGVLEKHLGVPIKRHREVNANQVGYMGKDGKPTDKKKDESIIVWRESGA